MLICDWHLDLAWNALQWDRDLTLPVAEVRRREVALGLTGPGRGNGTVTLPALRQGGVGIVAATLLARHDRSGPLLTSSPPSGFTSTEAAYAVAKGQLAYYDALADRGLARILTDWPALNAHAREWAAFLREPTAAEDAPPIGLVLAMEGADPIRHPDDLTEWWKAGLRMLSLSHYGVSRYSHGTGVPGPLNPPAAALLREMERLGVILDITHLADEALDQVFERFGGVVLASHHNCRALVNHQRQLRDRDILMLAGRGGVIGVAFDNWMLDPGCGQTGSGSIRRIATLEDVADHIDHICQLTGSSAHAALGTDLDGGFGTEQSPLDLDSIADLRRIPALLERRGYAPADIKAIMHGNWLGLMRRAWAKSDPPVSDRPPPRAATVGATGRP